MRKHIPVLVAVISAFAAACTAGDFWGDYKDGSYEYAVDGMGGSGSGSGENSNAGTLTASEWNDLGNWQFWTKLLNSQGENSYSGMPAYWGFDTRGRVAVHVSNPDESDAVNVPVKLFYNEVPEWETRTDNHGNASLWLGLYGMPEDIDSTALALKVADNPVAEVPAITSFRDTVVLLNEIKFAAEAPVPAAADIAFIVDATGSMYDEIAFLKDDLMDILGKVKKMQSGVSLRTAALFYRDEDGDEYVTRPSDFSSVPDVTSNFVKQQDAAGGGDYPEAVHQALSTALQSLSWEASTRNRIAFLILDAPAHHESKVISSLQTSVRMFAKNGIRIIPVVASGADKNTEFMCRFFAIATGGTYVFLTNDSGVGGDHIEASVGECEVEQLNALIVRLISENIE